MGLIDQFKKKFIFEQQRIGQYGIEFTIYKIRSMKKGSDERYDETVDGFGLENVGNPSYDPRVTVIGKYLRRSRLDELPQFINVFRREMAVIGLRPLPQETEKYLPRSHAERRRMQKPGLFPIAKSTSQCNSLDEFVQNEERSLAAIESSDQKLLTKLRFALGYFFRRSGRKATYSSEYRSPTAVLTSNS